MLAVVLGGIGVFVPGLPTTIFLIVASYCFARSCPWLEERLLRVPLFAPYMRFIDERRPMSTRARVVSITATWTSVLLSLAWLRASGRLSTALAVTIIGVACDRHGRGAPLPPRAAGRCRRPGVLFVLSAGRDYNARS